MSSSDLHEALFKWPHPEPSDVVVTGSFDGWSKTIHLSRTPSGFAAKVKIPWGEKTSYKYIVDGRWTTTDTQPTEMDPMGNVNNVYNAPARPVQPVFQSPPAVLAPAAVTPAPIKPDPKPVEKTNGVLPKAKETAVGMVEAIAPGTTDLSEPVETPTEAPEPTLAESTTAAVKNAASVASETTTIIASATVSAITAAVSAVSSAVAQDKPAPEEEKEVPVAESAPEPQPSEPAVVQEVSPESVLPPSAANDPVAPEVPVSILPLAVDVESSSKAPEVAIVEGSATSQEVSPPPVQEVSTHAPIIVNGEATLGEPTTVSLPPVTPSEIPAATPAPVANGDSAPEGKDVPAIVETPATNGESKLEEKPLPTPATKAPEATPVAPSTPASAPTENGTHSHKRLFPTLGRQHRHSSSTGSHEYSETSSGSNTLPSRSSSQRKQRKSSFFGKIKDLFHHDHKEKV
ncbi:hypothetical protein EIP91_003241 [Steccherinum ochraceum]|uniref:AMP-activated protein kinase glycogen-binding domain-containing protein n=1 Tax=Steccherinum ochraceum TaxID=92696 RepID=A0A4R0RNU5_9APHY|nr:hypothetical protein EIP91_003241 [Steccherinum ochraceum]